MRITLFIIVACLLATGCQNPKPVTNKTADSVKKDTAKKDTTAASQKLTKSFPDIKMVGDTDKQDDASNFDRPWIDSMIVNYVKHTGNKRVRATMSNKLKEEWMLDQIIKTDTAVYAVYNVGHDVADKGGANSRYVTDSWIYIDTAKRKLYENGANNHLTEWKK